MTNKYLDIASSVEVKISQSTRLLSVILSDTTSSARQMLEKIYTACELEAEVETTTITCDPPQNIASNVHSHGADLHVAIFGLSPKQIGALWTVSPYQWINVGQQTWCFAERLEIIEADLEKKKQLWSCLKILKPS